MATAVIMPKAGITVESCIIGEWQKKVGDQIKLGDILFTYETDKASFECESTAEGELLEIFYGEGDEVPCLINVCAIGTKGEDCSALRGGSAADAPTAAPAAASMQLNQGDMVEHTAFGKGMVMSVRPMGGDALLEVAFDTVGTKKLMLKSAGSHMKKL